jgi:hypothetical protein
MFSKQLLMSEIDPFSSSNSVTCDARHLSQADCAHSPCLVVHELCWKPTLQLLLHSTVCHAFSISAHAARPRSWRRSLGVCLEVANESRARPPACGGLAAVTFARWPEPLSSQSVAFTIFSRQSSVLAPVVTVFEKPKDLLFRYRAAVLGHLLVLSR